MKRTFAPFDMNVGISAYTLSKPKPAPTPEPEPLDDSDFY